MEISSIDSRQDFDRERERESERVCASLLDLQMAFFLEHSKNVVLTSFLVLRMLFDCGDSPLEMLLLCAQWTNQLSLEKTTSGILFKKRNANSEPTGRSTPSMNRNDRHCWIMASSF